MILARFDDAASMASAAQRVVQAGGGPVESFGPSPPDPVGYSPVPAVMLGLGLAAAVGTFAMQAYAGTGGYRLDIGGRPDLFWPAYVPFSVEAGILAAMLGGLVAFLVAARMPALYDPVDEGGGFADSSRDGWFLAVADHSAAVQEALGASASSIALLPG